jgi:hypothetical protein
MVGDDAGSGDGDADAEMTLTMFESMVLGATAGGLSAIATHPIDTVKTNMQAKGGGGYKNAMQCLVDVVRKQGVRGLYEGLQPRFVRVCLEIGLHFTLYERISRYLDKLW